MKIIYCPSLPIFHVVCENCQNYIYGPSSCLLLIPFKPTHCSAVIDRDAWKTLRPHWSQHELHRNEHVFSHKITQVFEAVSFDFQQFVSLEAHFLVEFVQISCKCSESKLVWTSPRVLWYFHHNFKYLSGST